MAKPHPALLELAAGRQPDHVSDPGSFVESAVEHRLAGYAFWAAERAEFGLDSATRQQLGAYKLQAAAQSVRLLRTAAEVIEALQGIGIAAALFKGVATESRWYPASGTRPAADVDLLLDPAAHGRLDDVIELLQPDHALRGAAQRLFDRGRIQGFDIEYDGIYVDFHTDPIKIGLPLPRIEEVWDRAARHDFGEVTCLALDAETSLLQAVIHLQKDRFSELHGFVDVARIAASHLDWDWIYGYAADAGLTVHLNEGLRAIAAALSIELPHRDGRPARWWQRLWPEKSRLRGKAGMTRKVRTHYWIPFTIRGRRWEALRWWLGIVVPAPEMIAYLHPQAKGPYLWKVASYRWRLAWSRHHRNRAQRHGGALED